MKTNINRWVYVLPILALVLSTAPSPNVVHAAVDGGTSSNIDLLDTNGNGKIDRITFDILNTSADTWTLDGAAPHGISVTQGGNAITVSSVSIATAANADPVTIQVNLDEADADLVVDTNAVSTNVVELIYTQVGGGAACTNCIKDSDEELNAIATGDTGATDTESDTAAPVISEFRYKDNDADGKIDRFTLVFSETLAAGSVLAAKDLTFGNVGDFTGAAFGADATDLAGAVANLDVVLGTEATAKDTNDGSGNLAITTQDGFSLTDLEANTNTTLGNQTQATYSDFAAPVISTFTYQDADHDGQVDQITVGFTETVTGAGSTLAANDLNLTNVGDFTGAAFGADATDLITSNVTSVAVPLGTESSVNDTTDDTGTLAISTQNGFSITDGTTANSTLAAQTQATFVDGAEELGSSRAYRQYVEQQQQQAEEETTEETPSTDDTTEDETPAEEETTEEQPQQGNETSQFGRDLNNNPLMMGSLVKVEGQSAVYYIDEEGVRHVFANSHVYFSWYGNDFSQVMTVSADTIAGLRLGRPVTFKPGTMIKITSDPRVYLVLPNRQIRHVANEQVARALFGDNWNKMIQDVDVSFFTNYSMSDDDISVETEVNLDDVRGMNLTINLEARA